MGVSKEPYRGTALKHLDNTAKDCDKISEWAKKAYKLLRYTGMHSACLYRPESQIREQVKNGINHIVWSRPMKGAVKGKKNNWEEVRGVPKSRAIDFDVREFYLQNLKSKRNYPAWKVKIHYNIHQIGKKADFDDVSPNTLRHSFLMELREVYDFPKKDIAEMAGCTIETLDKHYNSLGTKDAASKLKDMGW